MADDKDAAMRAEFHEAARKRFGEMGLLNLNGVYAYHEMNTAWWAWQEATRRASAREAEPPTETPPGPELVDVTTAGQTYRMMVMPRPGMSKFGGQLFNAMDELLRQGLPVGYITSMRYVTEEPCKN